MNNHGINVNVDVGWPYAYPTPINQVSQKRDHSHCVLQIFVKQNVVSIIVRSGYTCKCLGEIEVSTSVLYTVVTPHCLRQFARIFYVECEALGCLRQPRASHST